MQDDHLLDVIIFGFCLLFLVQLGVEGSNQRIDDHTDSVKAANMRRSQLTTTFKMSKTMQIINI